MIEKEEKSIRAVLVALCLDGNTTASEKSLLECERLLDTAGGVCIAKILQNKDKVDVRTIIGKGKAEELATFCQENDIELVVFDGELSPSQIRNLEEAIDKDGIRVIDRSILILDIFAKHAITSEGKLQVELAQLKYTVPRLTGKGIEMSRLGGGIGTRGPGESQLETDKRHLQHRMQMLEKELAEVEKNRKVTRASREKSGVFRFAIVGYTNAGKSTLLNKLTNAGILAEDKLFATLDPTTRKYTLATGEEILLTDTVGFIRGLPTHLIHAFHSTLEEAVFSDALLLLVNASDEEFSSEMEVTKKLLEEIGVGERPILTVFNKCDKITSESNITRIADNSENCVFVSALHGNGFDKLLEKMTEIVHNGKKTVTFLIPQKDGSCINLLYSQASVLEVEYLAEGTKIKATVDERILGQLKKYQIKE